MTMVLNESGGDIAIVSADKSAAPSVSWGAVIAGAVAAAAVSLLLMLLGSAFGLTVISPWSAASASLTTVAASALVWVIVVHWIASAVGGYMAGRLRTGWTGLHRDEVTFRDTAHGFLAWGIAVLVVAALSGAAASTVLFSGARIAATGVQAAATVAGGATSGATQSVASGAVDPNAYLIDTLFRPATTGAAAPPATVGPMPASQDLRNEVGRILVKDVAADQFPVEDSAYLDSLVAQQTGVSPDVAKMRVDAVVTSLENAKAAARDAADKARKATATAAFGLVLALLVGAFVASVAAALGGHLRDEPSYS